MQLMHVNCLWICNVGVAFSIHLECCNADDKIRINNWSHMQVGHVLRAPVRRFTLSLHFNGHFPGEPGLASVYWSKGDGSGGDNWSYKTCKAPVKSSPPTNQHPVFYRPDALPVAQPTVSKHWREKYHIPFTCLPQAHLGVFQLVFDH